ENGTVLPKTKPRTKTPLSTCERAEESRRSVSCFPSIPFPRLITLSLITVQPTNSARKIREKASRPLARALDYKRNKLRASKEPQEENRRGRCRNQ
ncbi:hypothetical protein LTR43_012385, partial [Exophiala xenobiotica]